MASLTSGFVVSSYYATKYNASTGELTQYTPSASGEITVEANDIIKFVHYNKAQTIWLSSIIIYAIGGNMKVQFNSNTRYPIYIKSGMAASIDSAPISSIKFLTAGTVYFEGMTDGSLV